MYPLRKCDCASSRETRLPAFIYLLRMQNHTNDIELLIVENRDKIIFFIILWFIIIIIIDLLFYFCLAILVALG